jgi:hypothetical protein
MTLWKRFGENDSTEMSVNMSISRKKKDYKSEEIKPQVLMHLTYLESKSHFSDLTFPAQMGLKSSCSHSQ